MSESDITIHGYARGAGRVVKAHVREASKAAGGTMSNVWSCLLKYKDQKVSYDRICHYAGQMSDENIYQVIRRLRQKVAEHPITIEASPKERWAKLIDE